MGSINEWKPLGMRYTNKVHEVLLQQHHLVQNIAKVGRSLIPQKNDDSHTSLIFIPQSTLLIGAKIPGNFRLAFDMKKEGFVLINQNIESISPVLDVAGKSPDQVFYELKLALNNAGVNVLNLKNKLHYQIPKHEVDNGGLYQKSPKKEVEENINYRQNADMVMNELVRIYPKTEKIRVWPHHFDTGSYIPVAYNAIGKLSKYVGIGWSIPDAMVNEPYFYLSYSSETVSISKLPSLKVGYWEPSGWKGAILPLSELLDEKHAENQAEKAMEFFIGGIKAIMDKFTA